MKRALVPLFLALLAGGSWAQGATAYQGADFKLGERLITQHKCNECHALKWADDGKAIYRPKGRISTPSALVAMVERCNNEMGLSLFPEEVTSIAAVLDREHYRFAK